MDSASFIQVMLALLLATGAGVLVMPAAISWGSRWGFVVHPRLFGRERGSISYLGGVALATAVVGALILSLGWIPRSIGLPLAGALTLLGLGFADDRLGHGVHPMARIAIETAVAALLWWAGLRSGVSTSPVIDASVTVFVLVAACNGFNLLDNMDGVAASTGLGTAAGVLLLGAMAEQPNVVVAAASLCGASLAFLRHNLVAARLFLGNGGALFMGFLLAGLALQIKVPNDPMALLVPACVLAVPALDSGTVIASRLRLGLRPFEGGLDHVSHRLVAVGQAPPRVAVMHGIAAIGGSLGAGVAMELGRATPAAIALAAFVVVAIALLHVKVYEGSNPVASGRAPLPEEAVARGAEPQDGRKDPRGPRSWVR